MSLNKYGLTIVAICCLLNWPNSLADEAPVLKCVKCDYGADPNCIKNVNAAPTIECESKKCFTAIENGVVKRGCLGGSSQCASPKCFECNTDLCNKNNICKKCDLTEADCAQSDVSDNKYNEICSEEKTKCFAAVKDKKVERRCAGKDDQCGDRKTCNLCDGPVCNDGFFPKDRLQCFQCSGADCKEVSKLAAKPCLLYEEGDKCFTHAASESDMRRGCQSDPDGADNKNPCPSSSSDKLCLTCSGDKCNSRPHQRDQQLKCIQCSSTKEDSSCWAAQQAADAKKCNKQVPYNVEDMCYTQQKGGVIKRGCYGDREEGAGECSPEQGCSTCRDSDGCNRQAADFTCIICRSDTETKCWNNANELTGSKCRTGDGSERGCFHGIWNNIAIRGCVVDADERMKTICEDKKNRQCNVCKAVNCNVDKTSGASSVSGALTTALLAALISSAAWWGRQ